eukprot:TRINITY_DN9614_c0_g1_i1.p7 TRINITY_DN9614_c0_g1~~TRINITY_DN9614_c0_g1_i1.p7  ORF type:complete len:173 (+),score=51.03 TRINITY_DN9614_c0_g1_i1:58-576(+)
MPPALSMATYPDLLARMVSTEDAADDALSSLVRSSSAASTPSSNPTERCLLDLSVGLTDLGAPMSPAPMSPCASVREKMYRARLHGVPASPSSPMSPLVRAARSPQAWEGQKPASPPGGSARPNRDYLTALVAISGDRAGLLSAVCQPETVCAGGVRGVSILRSASDASEEM